MTGRRPASLEGANRNGPGSSPVFRPAGRAEDLIDVSGTGRGKLLLFGEHAAVYGHPALGLPLASGTTVTLGFPPPFFGPLQSAAGTGEIRFGEEVEPEDRQTLSLLVQSVRTLLAERYEGPGEPGGGFPLPLPGTVRIVSDLPRGLGFGSSAALCVAVTAAFARFAADAGFLPALSGTDLRLVAHRAERMFHASPSGIDTGLSFLPGLRLLRPAFPPADSVPSAERLPGVAVHLVAGAVARRSDTRGLIRSLRERLSGAGGPAMRLLARLGEISGDAASLIRSGIEPREIAGGLGELAREAQGHLRELDLSSPDLDRVLEAGRSAGALGGKLSGAGGGGAFFLVASSPEHAGEIAERLQRLHAREGGPILFGPLPVSLME